MNIKQAATAKEQEDAYSVRSIVFIEEQRVPLELEMDEYDNKAIHLVGYEDNEPIAASRVRFTDSYGKLERICVVQHQRGKSHGSQIIRAMEDTIKQKGFQTATLNAQIRAVSLYKRLGYEVVSDEFMDAGIPHVTMTKSLA
ncbi:GNAT family N-acetyltransferase [Lentibacillus halophilus]|uniref:GNAT family N-acetyltransferase n=1 Tax=Lentibacillus halophilus TaxID=295065 RepID=A0ABN0Z555_9BACI